MSVSIPARDFDMLCPDDWLEYSTYNAGPSRGIAPLGSTGAPPAGNRPGLQAPRLSPVVLGAKLMARAPSPSSPHCQPYRGGIGLSVTASGETRLQPVADPVPPPPGGDRLLSPDLG